MFSCNDRCDQAPHQSEEGLIEQLSNGPRAFQAPVDNLMSNWGYMLMGSLAWTLKGWLALWLRESGRWKDRRQSEKSRLLKIKVTPEPRSFPFAAARFLTPKSREEVACLRPR